MGLLNDIKQMAFFKDFTSEERDLFFSFEQAFEEYHAGDVIIHEGEKQYNLYLLLKGSVIITKSGYDYVVNDLGVGEVFGEMSFLSKKPRYNNVIATDRCIVIRMDDTFFATVGARVLEKVKQYLINLLITRLDEMNDNMVKVFPAANAA